jgi:hypothetical protein
MLLRVLSEVVATSGLVHFGSVLNPTCWEMRAARCVTDSFGKSRNAIGIGCCAHPCMHTRMGPTFDLTLNVYMRSTMASARSA